MAQDWYEAARLPATKDLGAFIGWLKSQGVAHQVSLEGSQQVVRVRDPELVDKVGQVASEWHEGVSNLVEADQPKQSLLQIKVASAPVTLALLCLCFIGFALVSTRSDLMYDLLFYHGMRAFQPGADAWFNIHQGEYWRLVTPIFLHYGLVHIAFNALWLGFLGFRIEAVYGGWRTLLLMILLGVISNIAQALVSFPIAFGGVSGVVYGLFSFVWLVGLLTREPRFQLPPALFPLVSLLMLISWTGLFDAIAGGEVADTAHTVGYLAGLSFGLITGLITRK